MHTRNIIYRTHENLPNTSQNNANGMFVSSTENNMGWPLTYFSLTCSTLSEHRSRYFLRLTQVQVLKQLLNSQRPSVSLKNAISTGKNTKSIVKYWKAISESCQLLFNWIFEIRLTSIQNTPNGICVSSTENKMGWPPHFTYHWPVLHCSSTGPNIFCGAMPHYSYLYGSEHILSCTLFLLHQPARIIAIILVLF